MTALTSVALTMPLSELRSDSLPAAGGKGANLGELIAAGLPVPPGFVVTTHAYRRTVRNSGIAERIEHSTHAAALREALCAVDMDDALVEAIRAAYRRLGGGPVAVRSSGIAEDLPGAAFAGQHDTFLNIVGDDALLDAVRRCWASLWSERVVEYRRDRGMDGLELSIAVVVQRMIASDAAGVMFTANPVSGERGQAVIDASPGLGEAVVSGMVTPDHYIVDKKSGKVVESRMGRREVIIRSVEGGGTEEASGHSSATPVLNAATVRALVKLGNRVETHFGEPQDTEWSLADGRLYLVQARPITAMPEPLESLDFAQRMGVQLISELLPIRPYPLDVTAWLNSCLDGVRQFTKAMGVRFPAMETFLIEKDGVVTGLRPIRPGVGASTLFIMLRSAWRADRYTREAMLSDPLLNQFFAAVQTGLQRDLSALSYQELGAELDKASALFSMVMRVRVRFLARCVVAAGVFQASLALLGRHRLAHTLLSAVDTKTAETNRALEALADRIRRDETLRAIFADNETAGIAEALRTDPAAGAFSAEFDGFLREHGHRESVMLLVSQPTWRDAPDLVLGMLKGMATGPKPALSSAAIDRAEAELFSHPLVKLPPVRFLLRRRLAAARGFTQFREDTHYYATMAQPVVRRILMEYGRRLTAAGALNEPGEVFQLRRGELRMADGQGPSKSDVDRISDLVSRRARLRESLGDTPLLDRRYLATKANVQGALVSGSAGSAGVVTAKVRVITGPSQFARLEHGEILVAPFTNPAWTPLFSRCAAVVVDTGAAMSHAAIVAREYGIPAVLGAAGATTTLSDGMVVTVDGDRGAVLSAGGSLTNAVPRSSPWRPELRSHWCLGGGYGSILRCPHLETSSARPRTTCPNRSSSPGMARGHRCPSSRSSHCSPDRRCVGGSPAVARSTPPPAPPEITTTSTWRS
jgi:phosphohistidine swiveling domain-containing protein